MIKHINIRDFQGVELANIEFGEITFFWGANGAGKSSIADAILYALTGEHVRGDGVADVVRQGAKSAEVTILVDDRIILRRRARSGGATLMLDSKEAVASDVERAVRTTLRAPPAAVSAALRAGAILDLPTAELQGLIADLTGAKVDADAIREALGDEIVEAANRIGVSLPKSLDELAPTAKQAEGIRVAAHRQTKALKADLDRLPAPEGELAQRAESTSRDVVVAGIEKVRKLREEAIAERARGESANEERARQLRSRRDELAAVPESKGGIGLLSAAESDLRKAERAHGAAEADVARLTREISALAKTSVREGDDKFAASLPGLRQELADAERELADAKASYDRHVADFRRLSAEIEALPPAEKCSAPCKHCAAAKADAEEQRLKKLLDKTSADGREASGRVEGIQARIDDLKKRIAEAEAASVRVTTAKSRTDLESKLAAAKKALDDAKNKLADAEKAVTDAKPKADAERRWNEARTVIERIDRELAEVGKPASGGMSVEELDAKLEAGKALLEAIDQLARRAEVAANLADAESQHADADAVAKACGPKGIRGKLVADFAAPFVDAANRTLKTLGLSGTVSLDASLRWIVKLGDRELSPSRLSDGERWRLLAGLQVAAAELTGVKFVVLDRTEVVDDRQAVLRLALDLQARGIQVLGLSCAAAPEAVPAVMQGYRVEKGQAHRIAAGVA